MNASHVGGLSLATLLVVAGVFLIARGKLVSQRYLMIDHHFHWVRLMGLIPGGLGVGLAWAILNDVPKS